MLDTFKIYIHKVVSIDDVAVELIRLRYKRVDQVFEEGDFSVCGDTLGLFPVNFNHPLRIEWNFDTIAKIYSFDRALNRKIIDYEFLIVIGFAKKKRKYKSEDSPLSAVLQIKKGDYVVHSRYGIGKFLGTEKLKVKEREGYYFVVEYLNQDKMYVSKEEAHLIQKYSSFAARPPKLTKLGSGQWQKIKAKVEKGIKAFALGFLRMEAQRKIIGGFKYSSDGDWQKKFEDGFVYTETPDQLKATIDVKEDMQRANCMDRIICGDVGYGKTEVAMRAAFKTVVDSKQVAFMVPTTVLAYQHYLNLCERVKSFPIKVEMLSRFRTPGEQRAIISELKEGKVDIIVGTHRMLSGDVNFKDLGLLIIDEEHKFGVEHKERTKRMKVGIDVLTMTATPIPRTLYMGLTGVKDISLIKTPPKQRLAIKTKLMEFSAKTLAEIITKEINRNGEVFVVHNRIGTIFNLAKKLDRFLPKSVKVGIIHGRLPSKTIEKVMRDFIERKINCLISTAIVESGIDITSANTIIINDAHQFGLADLHQLRGRVGRMNRQAYAYVVVPRINALSGESLRRLRLIEEFSHLGAGFEIAMSDLELRGAGNLLGREQHGFVWMVGFDLYCRLLKKEIEYLRDAFKI
ncbi:MAG: DEAD/DEAH box helicase [Candidatus Omnitrophica bacterium]|nr:DEAD/DEAH box helicase [Candidatus Omnitrophota bacterium]